MPGYETARYKWKKETKHGRLKSIPTGGYPASRRLNLMELVDDLGNEMWNEWWDGLGSSIQEYLRETNGKAYGFRHEWLEIEHVEDFRKVLEVRNG